MKVSTIYYLVIIATLVFACSAKSDKITSTPIDYDFPYDLSDPEEKHTLPESLKEVSGIAIYNEKYIAAVQDEKGSIYMYSLKDKKVKEKMKFGDAGDYEGITIHDRKAYVIASNGKFYSMDIDKNDLRNIQSQKIKIEINTDIEGLCYHPQIDKFLIAFKGRLSKNDFDERSVVTYDGSGPKYNKKLFYSINNRQIKEYINADTSKRKDLEKLKEKLSWLKPAFFPSEIAIHPLSGDIFMISSVNKLLIVVDAKKQQLKYLEVLDDDILPHPEGMTFKKDGTLFISSEAGNGKKARIMEFEME